MYLSCPQRDSALASPANANASLPRHSQAMPQGASPECGARHGRHEVAPTYFHFAVPEHLSTEVTNSCDSLQEEREPSAPHLFDSASPFRTTMRNNEASPTVQSDAVAGVASFRTPRLPSSHDNCHPDATATGNAQTGANSRDLSALVLAKSLPEYGIHANACLPPPSAT